MCLLSRKSLVLGFLDMLVVNRNSNDTKDMTQNKMSRHVAKFQGNCFVDL